MAEVTPPGPRRSPQWGSTPHSRLPFCPAESDSDDDIAYLDDDSGFCASLM